MSDPDPVRLTPAGNGTGRPFAVAALITLVIGVGLLKPWGAGSGSGLQPAPGAAAQASAPAPSGASHVLVPASLLPAWPPVVAAGSPVPASAAGSPVPASAAGSPCYWGMAWRLFTTETSDVGPIHTWYGLQPHRASGPADPGIQVTRIHSSAIGQLGYCNVSRPGPIHILGTQAWILVPGGPPQPISLAPAVGTAPVDPDTGVIYRPPSTTAWPPATYVFGIHLATTPLSEEWFAVQIL